MRLLYGLINKMLSSCDRMFTNGKSHGNLYTKATQLHIHINVHDNAIYLFIIKKQQNKHMKMLCTWKVKKPIAIPSPPMPGKILGIYSR